MQGPYCIDVLIGSKEDETDGSKVGAKLAELLLERGMVTAEQPHHTQSAAATRIRPPRHPSATANASATCSARSSAPAIDLEQTRPDPSLYANLDLDGWRRRVGRCHSLGDLKRLTDWRH